MRAFGTWSTLKPHWFVVLQMELK
ncbi:unnamed protein product, partial [Didymodactylos carnosus]